MAQRGRRGHGEGSIFKATDGRWVAEIDLGHQDGKRKRKKLYGKTQKEVQEKLRAALRAKEQGLPPTPECQTVGQFLDQWLDETAKPTIRPRTYPSYSDLIRLHIRPALGRQRLQKLTPQELQSLLNTKQVQGLSASTVKYIHAVLRRSLGQAVKWGLVARNVAALVDPPRVEREEVVVFTPAQARTFLDAIRGHRLEALYIDWRLSTRLPSQSDCVRARPWGCAGMMSTSTRGFSAFGSNSSASTVSSNWSSRRRHGLAAPSISLHSPCGHCVNTAAVN
jgi:hypothetical protein